MTSQRKNGTEVGHALAGSDRVAFGGSLYDSTATRQAATNSLMRVKLKPGGRAPQVGVADAHDDIERSSLDGS